MCGRIVLWAIVLGAGGGWGGVLVALEMWPGDWKAPGIGLVAGAILGAAVGAFGVLLLGRRRPGD